EMRAIVPGEVVRSDQLEIRLMNHRGRVQRVGAPDPPELTTGNRSDFLIDMSEQEIDRPSVAAARRPQKPNGLAGILHSIRPPGDRRRHVATTRRSASIIASEAGMPPRRRTTNHPSTGRRGIAGSAMGAS